MNDNVTTIIQHGIALEQQERYTDALKHYTQSRVMHPAVLLRMAYLTTIIDNRDFTEKMLSLAATSPSKIEYHSAAALAQLPQKTILMVDYFWFSFSAASLVKPIIEQDAYIIFAPRAVQPISLPDLTRENARSYMRNGFLLLDLCTYDLCVLMELDHPNMINPSDDYQWPIIQAVFNHTASLLNLYDAYFDFYKPACVVYPQGYMLTASILRHLAQKHDIPTIALENICDPTRLLYETETGISVTHNSVASRFNAIRDTLNKEQAESYWASYYAQIKSQRHGEHQSPDTTLFITKDHTQQKIITFLAQVGTDSSVLFGLKNFKSQIDLIIETAQQTLDQGHIFVLKLHPKEKTGQRPIDYQPYNQLTLRHLQSHPDYATLEQNPHFMIDRDNQYDTYQLIEQSDACITINSQSGLEAACMGKPVIVCGDCAYSLQGFTWDGTNSDKLRNCITDILSNDTLKTHTDLARLFFYHYTHYCAIERTPEALTRFIVDQAN
jgi:hypothetical protein